MAGFEEEFEKIYIRYFHDVFLFLKKLSKAKVLQRNSQAKPFLRQCVP